MMFIHPPKRSVAYRSLVPMLGVSTMGRSYSTQNPGMAYNLGKDDVYEMYRIELHAGETAPVDSGTIKERSELTGFDSFAFNTDVWLSHSMFIEPGAPTSSPFLVLHQFHNTPDSGEISPSPSWSLEMDTEGVLQIVVRGSAANPLTGNPAPTYIGTIAGFQRGMWFDFVHRIRFAFDLTGQVQTWANGVEQFNVSGIRTAYNDAVGPYHKFGAYRDTPSAGESFAVRHVNAEVGYSSLLSRVNQPKYYPK